MKTAIIYYSNHHYNTKKLLDAIIEEEKENIDLIEAKTNLNINMSEYDLIGFASGIYYSDFHETVLQFAEKNLPHNKNVFLIYTYGIKRNVYINSVKQILDSKKAKILGDYSCQGFNTFGPLKLFGGMNKKHPNDEDIKRAIEFFNKIKLKEFNHE